MKTGVPNPTAAGQTLTYIITVTNGGPSPAQDVEITDVLSPDLLNAEYSMDQISWFAWNESHTLGILEAGAVYTLYLRAFVSPDAVPGTISNTVNVTSQTPDPDPGNNEYTEVITLEGTADLSVTKTAYPDTAISGEKLTYTIHVTNKGPSEAVNILISDVLPPALENAQYSIDGVNFLPWNGQYNQISLSAGDAITLTIIADVSLSQSENLFNTVSVFSDTFDPDMDNNRDSILTPADALADMQIIKTGPDSAAAGETVLYTLTITNNGPSRAMNINITDVLPAEVKDPEFTLNGIYTGVWIGSYFLTSLDPSESAELVITGTLSPSASGTLENVASVSASTPDPDLTNNTSETTTTVTASADLSIAKTAAPSPAVPGNLLTYTVSVSNAGPSDARNVQLIDPISSLLSSVEYSVDSGENWTPWQGTFNLGTLQAGTGAIILIRGNLSSAATGAIENIAIISSTTPDPDPENNASTLFTPVQNSADLSVVKSAEPVPAVPGQYLTYTVTVHNAGPDAADNQKHCRSHRLLIFPLQNPPALCRQFQAAW